MAQPWSKFLVSSAAWMGSSHKEGIGAAHMAGFAGVEILCSKGHFDWDSPSAVQEVGTVLDRWPEAEVSLHAPYETVDLASTDPEQWQASFETMSAALKVAAEFNAKTFVIHPRDQANGPNWSTSNLPPFQRSVSRLMHLASERRIKVAIENTGVYTSDEDDMLDLLELFPPHGVGACFDTGHAQIAGNLLEFARLVTPRTFVMHLHDNDGESDKHSLPGKGTIDWDSFVDMVSKREFHADRVMEVRAVGTPKETMDMIKESIVNTALANL